MFRVRMGVAIGVGIVRGFELRTSVSMGGERRR